MYEGKIEKYDKLARISPYMHIEKAMPFDAITMMLRRYDWGCMAYYFDENDPRSLTYASSFASRFMAYISAGLPIICSREYSYMADIVRTYGNGIVVEKNDIPNLSHLMVQADMDKMNQNALTARQAFNMQTKYHELNDFICKLT
jgi:glycosyltransferase involved in cell wall biosynthesis